MILLALVDADYKFLYVDVGSNGRNNDASVFNSCSLAYALRNGGLDMPSPECLPDRHLPVPYTVIGDEIFALKPYLMKPLPGRNLTDEGRIYNYRLSRARRTVENAFGILANRFGVFQTTITLPPEKVELIILASCVLHNFLRLKSPSVYTPDGFIDSEVITDSQHNFVPGLWRERHSDAFIPLQSQSARMHVRNAKDVQKEFCAYFNSAEGAVPWQWQLVFDNQ